MAHQRYLKWLALWITPLVGLLIYLVVLAEGFEGDLTRLGSLPESQYGWVQPQRVFEKQLYVHGKTLADYNQPFDVVVVGDSFSHSDRTETEGWVNHLIEQTGGSTIVFHLNDLRPEEVSRSDAFARWPPKLFVLQSVERNLPDVLGKLAATAAENAPTNVHAPPAWSLNPQSFPRIDMFRPRNPLSFDEEMSAACWDLKQSLRRILRSGDVMTAVLPLKDEFGGLFSSPRKQSILILRDDLNKPRLDADAWRLLARGAHGLGQSVQSNGKTAFSLVIFPDKLTAYRHVMADGEQLHPGHIDLLAQHISIPRIDRAYRDAIIKRMIDVYLPNDTHTSSEGNRIAAEAIVRYLIDRNFMRAGNH